MSRFDKNWKEFQDGKLGNLFKNLLVEKK